MPQVSLCGQQLNVAPSSQKISETGASQFINNPNS